MRQSSANDLQTIVDIDKGRGKVTIEAVDAEGNFVNFLNPKARLVTPDLKGSELNLDQTGPGRYEADFDARQLGTYLVNIRTKRGDKTVSQITGGVLPYSPEYNSVGTNAFLLSQVADQGGGKIENLDKPSGVFTRPRIPARAPTDIWLPLLALAALLFPLDVAVRRLVWDDEDVRNLKARLRGNKSAPKLSTPQRDERLGKLLKTKEQTRAPQTPPTQTELTQTSAPVAPPPQAPPAPGTIAPDADVPAARPVSSQPAPPPVAETPTAPVVPEEDDPMERLRRAKRRARGEE
jgi:hypothetical protein